MPPNDSSLGSMLAEWRAQHALVSTPPGMPGTHPQYFGWGTSTGISPQYYYVLSDITPILVALRSASSRFHSATRRHQFASVRQADSRLTRVVPPTLNSRWRRWQHDITRTSFASLLEILRKFHPGPPKDPRTLLKTPTGYIIRRMAGSG